MFRLYLSKTVNICRLYLPISGLMHLENMPGYRAPHIYSDLATNASAAPGTTGATSLTDLVIAQILTSIMLNRLGGHKYIMETVPIVTAHCQLPPSECLFVRLRHSIHHLLCHCWRHFTEVGSYSHGEFGHSQHVSSYGASSTCTGSIIYQWICWI